MTVFIAGVTGYVGGTVADRLVASGYRVRGLVRGVDRAAALKARGIEPVAGELDDLRLQADEASRADAVIHAANADHRPSVEAMLTAVEGSGKVFIHTSGAGIVADKAGGEERPAVYDETTPVTPLPARAARVALNDHIRAFAGHAVRTVVIAPPMIYGRGTGLHTESIQIPRMMTAAQHAQAGVYVGAGTNRWSNVHVEDLADLYVLALKSAPPGSFYFTENGEVAMAEIARSVSRRLGFGGKTRSLNVADAYQVYGEAMVDLSFGSNCRVRAVHARQQLGWAPHRLSLLDDIESRE